MPHPNSDICTTFAQFDQENRPGGDPGDRKACATVLRSDGNDTSSAMSQTPLHDWLRPRLEALLSEAESAGFQRDIALAVLQDLATSSPAPVVPTPSADD